MNASVAVRHVLTGSEYIEVLTTDSGSVVSYHCSLCECSFTDPAARLKHLNGRRHLINYKVITATAYLCLLFLQQLKLAAYHQLVTEQLYARFNAGPSFGTSQDIFMTILGILYDVCRSQDSSQ